MKTTYRLLLFFLSTTFISLSNLVLASTAYADRLQDFITKQEVIRVTTNNSPGSGNQAASFNIIEWLQKNEKYTNKIELVYGYESATKDKIISLFNLPKDIPDIWEDASRNIKFIRENEFIRLNKMNKITSVLLGIGSSVSTLCDDRKSSSEKDTSAIYTGLTSLECRNHANFYNTDTFILISPYPQNGLNPLGYVSYKNNTKNQTYDGYYMSPLTANHPTYIPLTRSNITEAKNLVANDTYLVNTLPALPYFIDGIINKDFDLLSLYGYGIKNQGESASWNERFYLGNMLQIITAARYAQQHGLHADRPLIIAVYYNYDKEIQRLYELIHDDNWKALLTEEGAPQARSALQKLKLSENFSVASLAQKETSTLLQKLKETKQPDQIILLSIGAPLPKVIFDAIYVHTEDNIWPQIREGANTFNSLITTGKPHFRCAGDGWEIGFDAVTDSELINELTILYCGPLSHDSGSISHDYEKMFCNGMHTWESADDPIYQTLGNLFIKSADTSSTLSQYFEHLAQDALNPKNDRIQIALELGLKDKY